MAQASSPERVCPECNATLGASATYCGCGWGKVPTRAKRAAQPALPPRACAHVECVRPALIRLRRPEGWADLCREHYLEHLTDDAKDFLADNDLLRRNGESMREWMTRTRAFLAERKQPGKGLRRLADAMREPGQDDRERAA